MTESQSQLHVTLTQSQLAENPQMAQIAEQLEDAIARGSYDEADFLQNQLKQFKSNYNSANRALLEQDHEQQLKAINDTYQEEQEHFNSVWEQRLNEFNDEARAKLEELKNQLNIELQELDQELRNKPVRFSQQLLELREFEAKSARSGNFEAAKDAQKKADKLEMQEVAEMDCENEYYREQQRLRLVEKFEKQGLILKQKVESARAETLAMWAADMDRIEKHYEAMLRLEEERYGTSRSQKSIVPETKIRITDRSTTIEYIESQGCKVDTRRLGSSMSPVMSGISGLAALRGTE